MTQTAQCGSMTGASREIDRQNEEFTGKLTELIADLRQEKEISRVLRRLAGFADDAEKYFSHQEACFSGSLSSFDAAEHRKRHRFFVHYLRQPLLTVNGNQCETADLCVFLTDWITFHQQYLDKETGLDGR